MSGLFIDLNEEETKRLIEEHTDEDFFVEPDGVGFIACYLENGEEAWLPNNYATEEIALKEILSEITGLRRACYYD